MKRGRETKKGEKNKDRTQGQTCTICNNPAASLAAIDPKQWIAIQEKKRGSGKKEGV